jgi:hypothetical protein
MTAPTRKQQTVVTFACPFRAPTKSGWAHRLVLRAPTGIGALDAIANFQTVAAMCGPAEIMRFCRDQITDRPERAAVIDEDDPGKIIAVGETTWREIGRCTAGQGVGKILQTYIALLPMPPARSG